MAADGFIARERGLFFCSLVATLFLVWLTSAAVLGPNYNPIFGWTVPYLWFGWLGAFIVALSRFPRWHRGEVPGLELLIPLLMLADRNGLYLNFLTSGRVPSVDELLFVFGRHFGHVEFTIGRWFYESPVLRAVCKWVYISLPLPVVVVYLTLPRDIKLRRRLWISFALLGLIGFVFYQFCPATGPIYRFRDSWPFTIPIVDSPHPVAMPFSNFNTIPSVHFASALLIVWYARYCARGVRIGGWIFAVLTALATLGLGEHYFIDLIVAVPFTVAVDGILDLPHCHSQRRRVYACFSIVLLWEIALCSGWALRLSSPAALLLSIATVIVPFVPIPPLNLRGGQGVAEADRLRPAPSAVTASGG